MSLLIIENLFYRSISMEKVLVSACLVGENCKYNGGNNKNEKIIEFLKDK